MNLCESDSATKIRTKREIMSDYCKIRCNSSKNIVLNSEHTAAARRSNADELLIAVKIILTYNLINGLRNL